MDTENITKTPLLCFMCGNMFQPKDLSAHHRECAKLQDAINENLLRQNIQPFVPTLAQVNVLNCVPIDTLDLPTLREYNTLATMCFKAKKKARSKSKEGKEPSIITKAKISSTNIDNSLLSTLTFNENRLDEESSNHEVLVPLTGRVFENAVDEVIDLEGEDNDINSEISSSDVEDNITEFKISSNHVRNLDNKDYNPLEANVESSVELLLQRVVQEAAIPNMKSPLRLEMQQNRKQGKDIETLSDMMGAIDHLLASSRITTEKIRSKIQSEHKQQNEKDANLYTSKFFDAYQNVSKEQNADILELMSRKHKKHKRHRNRRRKKEHRHHRKYEKEEEGKVEINQTNTNEEKQDKNVQKPSSLLIDWEKKARAAHILALHKLTREVDERLERHENLQSVRRDKIFGSYGEYSDNIYTQETHPITYDEYLQYEDEAISNLISEKPKVKHRLSLSDRISSEAGSNIDLHWISAGQKNPSKYSMKKSGRTLRDKNKQKIYRKREAKKSHLEWKNRIKKELKIDLK